MNPLCSIIIPAFNAAAYIGQAIDSTLLQQCDFDFEIIVIDDGSEDHTAQVVRGYGDKVCLLKKENGGPGSARNHGAAHARTDILVFLDADDKMLPDRLAYQVSWMLARPDIGLTFGNRLFENDPQRDANLTYGLEFTEGWQVLERAFQRLIVLGDYVQLPASAVRLAAYRACGGMPADIYVGEDYAVYCKIALENKVAYTSRKLTWYRQQSQGNLMSSSHTYYGPVKVLYENLEKHGDMLTRQEYAQALSRFHRLADALIRYEWAVNGREAAITRLDEFAGLLSRRFRLFWQMVSVCPPAVGRSVRRTLHRLRGQIDRRWGMCEK